MDAPPDRLDVQRLQLLRSSVPLVNDALEFVSLRVIDRKMFDISSGFSSKRPTSAPANIRGPVVVDKPLGSGEIVEKLDQGEAGHAEHPLAVDGHQ